MCKNTSPATSAAATTTVTPEASPASSPASTPVETNKKPADVAATDATLPPEIQALERDLARRLEAREPVAWHVGKLGPYYQQWVWKTRTKEPIRFFESELWELLTYSHWAGVLAVYIPVLYLYWSFISDSIELPERAFIFVVGLMSWPFLEHIMHRYVFHMNSTTYIWNSLHFTFHGQHHVCICDPLRLVFPPHIAYTMLMPFKAVSICVAGWDRALCWGLGLSVGFICYDMCHHALHHTHFKFLQRLRLRHLTHHYGQPDKYFGVSHEFTDEWFGTGGWGKKELNQARDYDKNE